MPFHIEPLDTVLDRMILKAERYAKLGNVLKTETEISNARMYANQHDINFPELRGIFATGTANVTAFEQTKTYIDRHINYGRIKSAYSLLTKLGNYANASGVPELMAEVKQHKKRLSRFLICECYPIAA